MTPWYKSKKVWTAVITLLGIVGARLANAPELQTQFLLLGCTLIGGISLQDLGKARTALGVDADMAKNAQIASLIPAAITFLEKMLGKDSERLKQELEELAKAGKELENPNWPSDKH